MLLITPLDNMFPPTWPLDATAQGWAGAQTLPVGANTVASDASRVRWFLGQNKVNYYTAQRYAGDLFKRDLLLAEMIKALDDVLSSRAGIAFNLPATTIWPGNYVSLGRFKLKASQTPQSFIVVADLKRLDGAQDDTLLLVLRNTTDAADTLTLGAAARATAEATKYFAATDITDRGTALPSDKESEVRLSNTHASNVYRGTATFVWSPSQT